MGPADHDQPIDVQFLGVMLAHQIPLRHFEVAGDHRQEVGRLELVWRERFLGAVHFLPERAFAVPSQIDAQHRVPRRLLKAKCQPMELATIVLAEIVDHQHRHGFIFVRAAVIRAFHDDAIFRGVERHGLGSRNLDLLLGGQR